MNVTSSPTGAKILVDGQDSGKTTPADLADLDPGKEIELVLDLPGKALVKWRGNPSAETPISIKLDKPTIRVIRLQSEPPGATVYLGKKKLGETPLEYAQQYDPKKLYSFRFALMDHRQADRELTGNQNWVREGEDKELLLVSIPLDPNPQPAAVEPPKAEPPKAEPPEPVVEPKPEPVVEPKPEPVVEPKPKPVVEPKPEPVVEPKPKPVVEPKPKAKPKAKPKGKPKGDDEGGMEMPDWAD